MHHIFTPSFSLVVLARVQRRMVLVVIFFRIFENDYYLLDAVGILDLVGDVGAIHSLC